MDSKSIFCFSPGLKPEQWCVLGWMFVSLPNSFVEILIHTVMVLKGGVLRSCVSHQSGALMSRISALIKETPGTPSPPHSCENTEANGHLWTRNGLLPDTKSVMPWSWAPRPPELGEIKVCCLTHPVYGIEIQASRDRMEESSVTQVYPWWHSFQCPWGSHVLIFLCHASALAFITHPGFYNPPTLLLFRALSLSSPIC